MLLVTVTKPGSAGTDTLTNVERIQFEDGFYDVASRSFQPGAYASPAVEAIVAAPGFSTNPTPPPVPEPPEEPGPEEPGPEEPGLEEPEFPVLALNEIIGTARADILFGGAGNDSLSGDAGDDILIGGPGNDTMNGGAGVDVAIFAGDRAGYTVRSLAGLLVQVQGADDRDTLTAVEILQFDDGFLDLRDDSFTPGFANDRVEALMTRTGFSTNPPVSFTASVSTAQVEALDVEAGATV